MRADSASSLSNDLSHATELAGAVREKRSTAAAGSGLGKQWIELGNASGKYQHAGTNDTQVTSGSDSRSTIWLSEQDMDDVFGILSARVECNHPAVTPRTIHIGASFAIVLVAYWAYALLAVPWIEPPPAATDNRWRQSRHSDHAASQRTFEVLFPPGSWQLGHDAKIINSNGQALLLWQKYHEPRQRLGRSHAADGHLHARRDRDRHGRALAPRRRDGSAGGGEPAFRPAAGPEKRRHRAADRRQASRAGADPQPRQAAGPSRRLARADPRRRSQRTADHHGQRRRFPLGSATRAAGGRWRSSSCPAWDPETQTRKARTSAASSSSNSNTSSGCTWIWARPRPPRAKARRTPPSRSRRARRCWARSPRTPRRSRSPAAGRSASI